MSEQNRQNRRRRPAASIQNTLEEQRYAAEEEQRYAAESDDEDGRRTPSEQPPIRKPSYPRYDDELPKKPIKKKPAKHSTRDKRVPGLIALVILEGLIIALILCFSFLYVLNGWSSNGIAGLVSGIFTTPSPVPTATPTPVPTPTPTPVVEYVYITPEPTATPSPTPIPTAIPTPVVEYVYITPEPTPMPTVDENTLQYENWAIYALEELYGMPWKNPESLQVHSIVIYTFPEQFKKTYTYHGNQSMEVRGDRVFISIEYSAQNGFGGMNRGTYAFYMQPQDYASARAKYLETHDKEARSQMLLSCISGDEDGAIYALLKSVKKETGDYHKAELNVDYLLQKYATTERPE